KLFIGGLASLEIGGYGLTGGARQRKHGRTGQRKQLRLHFHVPLTSGWNSKRQDRPCLEQTGFARWLPWKETYGRQWRSPAARQQCIPRSGRRSWERDKPLESWLCSLRYRGSRCTSKPWSGLLQGC